MRGKSIAAGVLALAVLAVVAVPASAAKNPKIAAEVPKAIAAKGTLIVASDATYAPSWSSSPRTAKRWSAWTPTSPKRSATSSG